jgi:hypothetical protein
MLEIVTAQIPTSFKMELLTVRKYKLFSWSKTRILIPCEWDYSALKTYT